MRPSPGAVFVVAAVAIAAGAGALATRAGAAAEITPIPSDAKIFGFVTHAHASQVPLLASTRPFTLALANGPVHGTAPDEVPLATATTIVTRELARYPESFLRKIRLAGIVFTVDLTENDAPIPSLPNVGGLLVLDVASGAGDLVHCLHHELFHFFDLADDGYLTPDPAWDALNAPGFAYGSGGRTLRGAWAAKPTTDLPGFVSPYGTSGSEEDKADLFAFAVARPDLVSARRAEDPILARKLEALSQRVDAMTPAISRQLGLSR